MSTETSGVKAEFEYHAHINTCSKTLDFPLKGWKFELKYNFTETPAIWI